MCSGWAARARCHAGSPRCSRRRRGFRPLLVAAVAGVVLVSSLGVLDAARDVHAVVELAQTQVFTGRS